MSSFLDLPPNLRNRIYELIVRNEPTWSLVIADDLESWRRAALGRLQREKTWSRYTVRWPAYERKLNVICSMAYACRQTRHEMTSIIAALRRPHISREAYWSDEHSEEAENSSLELRVQDYHGKVVWNVKYGILPAKQEVFLVSEEQLNIVVRRKLVAAMRAYMAEKNDGLMAGDFDAERMAALTVAEFQSGFTASWSFSLHRRTTECIGRVFGVRFPQAGLAM